MSKRRWLASAIGLAFGLACHRHPVDVVAWVDDAPITRAQVELELRFQGAPAALSVAAEEALQEIIDRRLMVAEAHRLGARINESDHESAIRLALGGSATPVFMAALEENKLRWQDWVDRIHEETLISDGVHRALRDKIQISGQDIKDYYWEHVTEFRRPARMRLRQIFTHRRRLIEQAQRELQLGDPFDEVARKHSASAEADAGGDLGLISARNLPKEIAQAVATLKPGKVSNIITTRWGWHLFLIEDNRPAFGYSLDQAAPQVRAELQRTLEQPLYQEWLANLRQRAKITRVTQGPPRPVS